MQAQAQGWPNRQIRLIVPQGAGSGTDVIARLVATGVTERLGQSIVVENMPAALGILAHQTAARAAPDGATLLFATVSGLAINPVTIKALPYDPTRDFTPVAMVVDFAPQMLSVNAELPVKSVAEFIDYAKASADKLSYALDVSVTAAVVSARLLNKRAGLDMIEIPYRSAAQMASDVANGRVQATVSSLAASGSMIEAGKIRPLGWMGSKRFSYLPRHTDSLRNRARRGCRCLVHHCRTGWHAVRHRQTAQPRDQRLPEKLPRDRGPVCQGRVGHQQRR